MPMIFRLREIRTLKNLKQSQLAELTGLHRQTIAQLEAKAAHGDLPSIKMDTLERLCKTLRVTPGELLIYQPEEKLKE